MCKYSLFGVILALFSVNEFLYETKAFRTIIENGVETILALENEMVNMECKTDTQMRYCGFIHPSGKRYSFTGHTTYDGKCFIKINVTSNDTGTWRCHIGSQSAGVEMIKNIKLRVVGEIAAVQSNITAVHGKSKTLYCTTTKEFIPLSYCRFEPPNAVPFSIDSGVTESNPLLKRYYFPSNKSLDRGDCAVTIHEVKYEDVGTWTCGAGLDDGNEYIDVIHFKVEGLYTMSTASATSITLGIIAVIVLLALLGFFAWKNHGFLGSTRRDETIESHEIERLPSRASSGPHITPQSRRIIPSVVIQPPSDSSQSGSPNPAYD